MRPRFRQYCELNLAEFEIFFPENAMKDYFSTNIPEPFDISDFEEIVGDLSHAIVIFPEAPGSFAETGYFSAISTLSEKTILALDSPRQKGDSFISMGPAKKIASKSIYQPNIQLDYENPTFDVVTDRIRRIGLSKNKKFFKVEKFADLSSYELFALIQKVVSILTIATIDDIVFTIRSIYRSKVSAPKIRHLTSILVGSNYLKSIGDYGHYLASPNKPTLFETRDGYRGQESSIRILLTGIYNHSNPEFLGLVDEAGNVD